MVLHEAVRLGLITAETVARARVEVANQRGDSVLQHVVKRHAPPHVVLRIQSLYERVQSVPHTAVDPIYPAAPTPSPTPSPSGSSRVRSSRSST